MGDRISISFKLGSDESVTLFSHWGGENFAKEAKRYANRLMKELEGKFCYPIERLEPNTVMVDFIRHITRGMERVNSDLYLGKDSNDGDNSDNGHCTIELEKEPENEHQNA